MNNGIGLAEPFGLTDPYGLGVRVGRGIHVEPAENAITFSDFLDQVLDDVQSALDYAGLFPGPGNIADVLNAGISLVQGEWTAAGLSILGAMPAVGQGVTIGKRAKAAVGGGPPPNGGNAKPHGGLTHNGAIDSRIRELQQNPSVSNIRKNQQQVDINGNRVGTNRPDIQYDQGGCHHCVEYDHVGTNSVRHGQAIRQNDPNTKVELNRL